MDLQGRIDDPKIYPPDSVVWLSSKLAMLALDSPFHEAVTEAVLDAAAAGSAVNDVVFIPKAFIYQLFLAFCSLNIDRVTL